MKSIFCFILASVLSGCMALGGSASSDPQQMLVSARELIKDDRTEAAKGLIDSAIAKYGETQNANGLGEAYYAMADLYKSPKFVSAIDGRRFTDYDKSLAYFTLAEEQYRSANNYEGMIRSMWALANMHTITGDVARACEEYLKSGETYREMMQKNPEQEPRLRIFNGYQNFPAMLQAYKEKYNCRNATVGER